MFCQWKVEKDSILNHFMFVYRLYWFDHQNIAFFCALRVKVCVFSKQSIFVYNYRLIIQQVGQK
jgi:hypothetical protein